MEIAEIYSFFMKSNGVSTDTRKLRNGEIFFALKGDNFDGNTKAEEALNKGALWAVIDNPQYKNKSTILVSDVLLCLQQLATYHRKQCAKTTFIALTGSNGKTTTKELMHTALSSSFTCQATIGNLNNHIGVPLTLLSIKAETQVAIIEMGANHQQEIAMLCNIALPDICMINNVGKAHLEGFGGIEGVRKGKGEMYDYAKNNNKKIIINIDDKVLVDMMQERQIQPILTYGINKDAQVKLDVYYTNWYVTFTYKKHTVESKVFGYYNIPNFAAAIACCELLNANIEKACIALGQYNPTNQRSELVKRADYEIILDLYNANPSSMEAAIKNFAQINHPQKIMILGDMFELGNESNLEHEQIAQLAASTPNCVLALVGTEFNQTIFNANNIIRFENITLARNWYQTLPKSKSLILIKGSRGMALEKLL